ncbi:MAG: hypothetical protein ACMV0Y_08900, partial [Paludibacter sp.]
MNKVKNNSKSPRNNMFGRLLVKGTMLMANIVVASVLLITLLATFISPNVFVIPAFATLLWPVTIVLNV